MKGQDLKEQKAQQKLDLTVRTAAELSFLLPWN
jgi:hypothetical protein